MSRARRSTIGMGIYGFAMDLQEETQTDDDCIAKRRKDHNDFMDNVNSAYNNGALVIFKFTEGILIEPMDRQCRTQAFQRQPSHMALPTIVHCSPSPIMLHVGGHEALIDSYLQQADAYSVEGCSNGFNDSLKLLQKYINMDKDSREGFCSRQGWSGKMTKVINKSSGTTAKAIPKTVPDRQQHFLSVTNPATAIFISDKPFLSCSKRIGAFHSQDC